MTDPRFLPIIPIARASHAKFVPRGPFISISLAQWAVESGYGAHMSGINNPFGIKATYAQIEIGRARKVITKEFIGGHYHIEEQWFANYDSIEEAFDYHARLLMSPHYQRCIDARTPVEYARALLLCGYATAPHYDTALMQVIDTNNLEQYDEAV